ncbi:hypothetical protein I0D00_01180 [Pseudomonas lalucatii]|uniref:Uncharacterized protein n=1 Tax=Pseudomonas lalucatii TaxID=1424203 RepID=A0ABS5PVZ3_9PSED|nr:hypothetical protein [Pseudomonas lalucatii]MBS7660564.1 hypothetical protein [Pseudomonas lalucatii]
MIDLTQVRKLSPRDGDVFALPAGTSQQAAAQFAEALHLAAPGVKCLVVIGELKRLSREQMNAAGWYRA